MWGLPERLEVKAIFLPSGEKVGDTSIPKLRVSLLFTRVRKS